MFVYNLDRWLFMKAAQMNRHRAIAYSITAGTFLYVGEAEYKETLGVFFSWYWLEDWLSDWVVDQAQRRINART